MATTEKTEILNKEEPIEFDSQNFENIKVQIHNELDADKENDKTGFELENIQVSNIKESENKIFDLTGSTPNNSKLNGTFFLEGELTDIKSTPKSKQTASDSVITILDESSIVVIDESHEEDSVCFKSVTLNDSINVFNKTNSNEGRFQGVNNELVDDTDVNSVKSSKNLNSNTSLHYQENESGLEVSEREEERNSLNKTTNRTVNDGLENLNKIQPEEKTFQNGTEAEVSLKTPEKSLTEMSFFKLRDICLDMSNNKTSVLESSLKPTANGSITGSGNLNKTQSEDKNFQNGAETEVSVRTPEKSLIEVNTSKSLNTTETCVSNSNDNGTSLLESCQNPIVNGSIGGLGNLNKTQPEEKSFQNGTEAEVSVTTPEKSLMEVNTSKSLNTTETCVSNSNNGTSALESSLNPIANGLIDGLENLNRTRPIEKSFQNGTEAEVSARTPEESPPIENSAKSCNETKTYCLLNSLESSQNPIANGSIDGSGNLNKTQPEEKSFQNGTEAEVSMRGPDESLIENSAKLFNETKTYCLLNSLESSQNPITNGSIDGSGNLNKTQPEEKTFQNATEAEISMKGPDESLIESSFKSLNTTEAYYINSKNGSSVLESSLNPIANRSIDGLENLNRTRPVEKSFQNGTEAEVSARTPEDSPIENSAKSFNETKTYCLLNSLESSQNPVANGSVDDSGNLNETQPEEKSFQNGTEAEVSLRIIESTFEEGRSLNTENAVIVSEQLGEESKSPKEQNESSEEILESYQKRTSINETCSLVSTEASEGKSQNVKPGDIEEVLNQTFNSKLMTDNNPNSTETDLVMALEALNINCEEKEDDTFLSCQDDFEESLKEEDSESASVNATVDDFQSDVVDCIFSSTFQQNTQLDDKNNKTSIIDEIFYPESNKTEDNHVSIRNEDDTNSSPVESRNSSSETVIQEDDKIKLLTEFLSLRKSLSKTPQAEVSGADSLINYTSLLEASPSVFARKVTKFEKQTDLKLRVNQLEQEVSKLQMALLEKESIILKQQKMQLDIMRNSGEKGHSGMEMVNDFQKQLESEKLKIIEMETCYENAIEKLKQKIVAQEADYEVLKLECEKTEENYTEIVLKFEKEANEKQKLYESLNLSDKIMASMSNRIEHLKKNTAALEKKIENYNAVFKDVIEKYERCKTVIVGLKKNEDILKNQFEEMKNLLKRQDSLYKALKKDAEAKLAHASEIIQDLTDQLNKKKNEPLGKRRCK